MTEHEVTVVIDYHHPLFLYMHANGDVNIAKRRHELTYNIVAFYTRTLLNYNGTSGIIAQQFIRTLQERLEKEMKDIISKRCIYYWFHLYRRIAPVGSFGGESSTTVMLYRTILECAFCKYGALDNKKELIASTETSYVSKNDIASGLYIKALSYFGMQAQPEQLLKGVFLGQFEADDLLAVYSLESLAHEFWYTTSCFRRITKGGILKISDGQYSVENDADTEYLMKSIDERSGHFAEICSTDGITVSECKLTKLMALVAKYNVEQLSLKDFPVHRFFGIEYTSEKEQEFSPNFIWLPIDFLSYIKERLFYSEAFLKSLVITSISLSIQYFLF